VKIILPWPDKHLSPNARAHWRPIAAKKKKARIDATWATLAAEGFHDFEPPASGQMRVQVTYFPPDARKRDMDNAVASSKALFDGIADALDVDDSRFCYEYQFGAPEAPGRVQVELG
jgi:crossover junction endodeoxyribonuclease RusA